MRFPVEVRVAAWILIIAFVALGGWTTYHYAYAVPHAEKMKKLDGLYREWKGELDAADATSKSFGDLSFAKDHIKDSLGRSEYLRQQYEKESGGRDIARHPSLR